MAIGAVHGVVSHFFKRLSLQTEARRGTSTRLDCFSSMQDLKIGILYRRCRNGCKGGISKSADEINDMLVGQQEPFELSVTGFDGRLLRALWKLQVEIV